MRVAAAVLGLYVVLTAGLTEAGRAQTVPDPGGGRGDKGGNISIVIPLNIGGVVTFSADGGFGAQVQGVHVSGLGGIWEAGSGQSGGSTPPDPPSISVSDLNALQDQARRWRIGNCLTQADATPCMP